MNSSRSKIVLGVDLGQAQDPTALAAVRRIDRGPEPVLEVGYLDRLPLGTTYPGVVTHVQRELAKRPPGTELVIDHTGVGRPVFDMFVARGLSPIGVTITAGDAQSQNGFVWRVPKLILVSRVQALLHDGRLRIQKTLDHAPALTEELQNFRAEYSDAGRMTFNARSGKHDDLVLALAIAVWRAHPNPAVPGMALFELERREHRGTTSIESAAEDEDGPDYAPGSVEYEAARRQKAGRAQ